MNERKNKMGGWKTPIFFFPFTALTKSKRKHGKRSVFSYIYRFFFCLSGKIFFLFIRDFFLIVVLLLLYFNLTIDYKNANKI